MKIFDENKVTRAENYHMLSFTTLGWQSGYEVLNPVIEVHYGPSFTIKREPQFGIPILQGMTVMLGCDVDANPVINATGKAIYNRLLGARGLPKAEDF